MSFVDRLLVPGDRVVCKMDRESRSWGHKGPPNGTLGTFKGATRFLRERSRYGNDRYFYEPGIYEANGVAMIDWDDGSSDVSGWAHELADKAEYKRRLDAYHAIKDKPFGYGENVIKVGELPETKFYELDIVRILNGFEDMTDRGYGARIAAVEWGWKKEDGLSVYRVEWIDKNGEYARAGHTYMNDSQLELVERGNVWKEFHGEPLIFKDLREEIAFAQGMGRYKEVRNPASNLFSWTGREAIEAVRDGIADGFSLAGAFLGVPPRPSLHKFEDRDLGERVRQATIAGFEGVVDPDDRLT
jgi:hypothetical protein